MRIRFYWLRAQLELAFLCEKRDEVGPEATHEDAPQVEHELRALAAPPHARAVESHCHDVTYSTLHSARGDVETFATKAVILHMFSMLTEVKDDGVEPIALALPEAARQLGQAVDDLPGLSFAEQL